MSKKRPLWYAPEDSTPNYQCPCCDYFTLPERGMYLICPVCRWEDEFGIDVDNLDEISGPNHISLREGRANFKEYGVSSNTPYHRSLKRDNPNKYEYKPRQLDSENE